MTMTFDTSLNQFIPDEFSPIRWQNNTLELLDQRFLPQQMTWLSFQDAPSVAIAIRDMVVRGAPAIGITAAYAVALSAIQHLQSLDQRSLGQQSLDQHPLSQKVLRAIEADIALLAESRPTAINLKWALDRMCAVLQSSPSDKALENLIREAIAIHQQDIDFCHRIGVHGANLIEAGSTLYTHCNAGALATGGHGTALGVIRTAFSQQKVTQVFAGETRPWMQGARLTSWELYQAGIPVKLVTEGAAGHTMKQHQVSWLIVGADRIAADGSVANKIGTYNLAILARHHRCKVMVAAPSSTFDLTILNGDDIPIEQRSEEEVTHLKSTPMAPTGVSALNPSFDVTPPDLVDAIVTELGVIHQPTREKIEQHFCAD